MLTKKDIEKIIIGYVKKKNNYNIVIGKSFNYLYEFKRKPLKEELLELYYEENLYKYHKYIFFYPLKNSFYYTFDSFTTDGVYVSFNTPDIAFYDDKEKIFNWINKKGNKSKFWKIYEEELNKYPIKHPEKVLEKVYDKILGKKSIRKKVTSKRKKIKPSNQLLFR